MMDLVIIGAGPIGLACGIEAKKRGLSYTIIDKGCLVNSVYNYPFNMTFFSTSDKLEIGDVPFISHGSKPNRVEALEYYRRVTEKWDLDVKLYERVEKVVPGEKSHQVVTEFDTYHTKNVILATGFYDLPFMMNIEGENLAKVKHYYDEPHPYFRQDIVVVGAANSAVDVALETWRKGARVTMVVREEGILPNVKYWVRPDIENRIEEGSIKAYFNSEIEKIEEKFVHIKTPQGNIKLKNDFVLAMTGYKPDFDFMKSMGIKFRDDEFHTPYYDENSNQTDVPGIYLAGVACGGLRTNKWFIENSRVHAPLILNDIERRNA